MKLKLKYRTARTKRTKRASGAVTPVAAQKKNTQKPWDKKKVA